MAVEEVGDCHFVDLAQLQALALNPSSEVRDVCQIADNCARRIPALGQVLLERINVRRDRTFDQPAEVDDTNMAIDTHGGLLKWENQCTRASRLCPVQDRATMLDAARNNGCAIQPLKTCT